MTSLNRPSKRKRESEEVPIQQKLQILLNNIYQDETDRSANIPNPNVVSTGLKLSYDDEEQNSYVTTASEPPLPFIASIGDIRTEIECQKEEFDHYVRIQPYRNNTFSTRNAETNERRKLYKELKSKDDEISSLKTKVSELETSMADVMEIMQEYRRQQRDEDGSGSSHDM